jgi:hypothetical protein
LAGAARSYDVIIVLICYAFVGFTVAMMSTIAIDDIGAPPGSEPAIMFVFGLLWPLTIAAVVLGAIVYAAFDVGRGFRALWRHAREPTHHVDNDSGDGN